MVGPCGVAIIIRIHTRKRLSVLCKQCLYNVGYKCTYRTGLSSLFLFYVQYCMLLYTSKSWCQGQFEKHET